MLLLFVFASTSRGPGLVCDHRPVKQKYLHKIVIMFLSISLNTCFGCSKEPSNRDGSFEYPQDMFWLRNKKNNFQLRTLIWGPVGIRLWHFWSYSLAIWINI